MHVVLLNVLLFLVFFENLSKTRVKNWIATVAIQFSTLIFKVFLRKKQK